MARQSQRALDCNTVPEQRADTMASGSGHPTAGRRSKYKSPATRATEEAIARLQPPTLPEYLRGDDGDGPSGSEEENEAKRLHSPSTTPRSARGTDPDDYDRIMGTPSVQPPEMARFGDGNVARESLTRLRPYNGNSFGATPRNGQVW